MRSLVGVCTIKTEESFENVAKSLSLLLGGVVGKDKSEMGGKFVVFWTDWWQCEFTEAHDLSDQLIGYRLVWFSLWESDGRPALHISNLLAEFVRSAELARDAEVRAWEEHPR